MKTIDEDFADGIEYGFPICCVLAFINAGGTANGKQALERGVVWNVDNPYVPCGLFHTADFIPDDGFEALRLGYYDGSIGYKLVQQVWSVARGRYVDG